MNDDKKKEEISVSRPKRKCQVKESQEEKKHKSVGGKDEVGLKLSRQKVNKPSGSSFVLKKEETGKAFSGVLKLGNDKSRETKRCVKFGGIELRVYPRIRGGSLGVPESGGYPLGLDFVSEGYFKDHKNTNLYPTISLFEKEKNNAPGSLEALSESKRKAILLENKKPVDGWEEESKILEDIRKSRTTNGCSCYSKGSCQTKKCECFQLGIECHEDACRCNRKTCKNPEKRYQYEAVTIHKERLSRIKQWKLSKKLSKSQETQKSDIPNS